MTALGIARPGPRRAGGTVWLRYSADGADQQEEVSASQVTGLLPRFNPGVEFKKALKGVDFEKIQTD